MSKQLTLLVRYKDIINPVNVTKKMNEKEIKQRIEDLQKAYLDMASISKEKDNIIIKEKKAQKALSMAKEAMRDIKFDY